MILAQRTTLLSRKEAELCKILADSLIHPDRNPVAKVTSGEGIVTILANYRYFPFEIVGILTRARSTLSWMLPVHRVLTDNIEEELGSLKRVPSDLAQFAMNVGFFPPHHDILVCGVHKVFGLDLTSHEPDVSTLRFLNRLWSCFFGPSPIEVAGSTYALESSAVPELEVIKILLQRLHTLKGVEIPFEGSILDKFLSMHLDVVELAHCDDLLNVFDDYIKTNADLKKFEHGFNKVIKLMEQWWGELAILAK